MPNSYKCVARFFPGLGVQHCPLSNYGEAKAAAKQGYLLAPSSDSTPPIAEHFPDPAQQKYGQAQGMPKPTSQAPRFTFRQSWQRSLYNKIKLKQPKPLKPPCCSMFRRKPPCWCAAYHSNSTQSGHSLYTTHKAVMVCITGISMKPYMEQVHACAK